MRINSYIALATGVSRRAADKLVASGQVQINQQTATTGQQVQPNDQVSLNGKPLQPQAKLTILLDKPVGYVCSRRGQGSKTIYDLLPEKLQHLKPVGRLDKDSSGLLIMTNDGLLANQLTHPRYQKDKCYQVSLDKPLMPAQQQELQKGVQLSDGISRLRLKQLSNPNHWQVIISEGRNRQIRRSFAATGHRVLTLRRTNLASYSLDMLNSKRFVHI